MGTHSGRARARFEEEGPALRVVGGALEVGLEALHRHGRRRLHDAAGVGRLPVEVEAAIGVRDVDVGAASHGEGSSELHALELGDEAARGGVEHRLAGGERQLEVAAERGAASPFRS